MDAERLRQMKSLASTVEPQDRPAIVNMIRQRAFRMAFKAFQAELNQCIGIHVDDSTMAKLEAVRAIVER